MCVFIVYTYIYVGMYIWYKKILYVFSKVCKQMYVYVYIYLYTYTYKT